MNEQTPGIDAAALERWLTSNVPDAMPPYDFDLVAAGGSNLTYLFTDADRTVRVLRRPPAGRGLQSAHDMSREFRIMSALGSSAVPVPECLAECTDPSIVGAGFYVMAFVEGLILRNREQAEKLSAADADIATTSLIETQVAMHTVDLDRVGLADLGRHDGYVERQLRRWKRQVDAADVRELPLIGELHERLSATVPPERARPALAHGDYRFDNTILGPDFSIVAVLDWELCTTGDPIADFAWSLRYWADEGDDFTWLPDAPTAATSFPARDEVVRRYAAASGFDLSDLGWYEVFSWWKQACIVEGVYARRLAGTTGGMRAGAVEAIAARVEIMLETAQELAADVL